MDAGAGPVWGVGEFLAEWARYQEAAFDLFHVIGALQDRGTNELRELLIRVDVPFRFPPRTARRAAVCSGKRAWTLRGFGHAPA